MKNILVPTDFSDNAANALLFGMEIAKRARGNLILLHSGSEGDLTKLNFLKDKYSKMPVYKGIKMEVMISKLDLVKAIKEAISKFNIDLIVMGTKGASGVIKVFIGSNTVDVIRNINCPLLAVPNDVDYSTFTDVKKNRVVLASDFETPNNVNVLDIFKELVLLMEDAKVMVLGVRPENTKLPGEKRLERRRLGHFLGKIKHSRITVFSEDVIRGINFYINQKSDVSWITMLAKDYHSGLFKRHYTAEMAHHTKLPLLVLHDS